MRLLLDTHALLWWATDDENLSVKARTALGDSTVEIYVSAASVWEIATKVRLGKLVWPEEVGTVNAYVLGQGFLPLSILNEHAARAGALPGDHRDPFDRMLIAQALAEDMALVSNERVFDTYAVRRWW